VLLGRIVGVHGVRGWVKVHSDTQPRENILSYPVWWLKGPGFTGPDGWQETKLIDSQNTSKNVLALIEGVQDRDVAEKLRGTEIAVPRESLPVTDSGEYYWTDLNSVKMKRGLMVPTSWCLGYVLILWWK